MKCTRKLESARTVASLSLVVAMTICMGTGCATTDKTGQSASKSSKPAKDTRPLEQRLSVGMTKAEVRAAIGGDPKSKSVSSAGLETWHYNDSEKGFIPYYAFFGKFKNLTINFDAEGKVKDWSSGESRAF